MPLDKLVASNLSHHAVILPCKDPQSLFTAVTPMRSLSAKLRFSLSARSRRTIRQPTCIMVLLIGILSLAGCGQSVEERRAEVVKCSGYIQTYKMAAFGGGPVMQFLTFLGPLSAGRPSGDATRLNAVTGLGDQLVPSLDQVRVRALATEGAKQWATHYETRDGKSILAFLDACIINYDELLKAAR